MKEGNGRLKVDGRVVKWEGIFKRIGKEMRWRIGDEIELRRDFGERGLSKDKSVGEKDWIVIRKCKLMVDNECVVNKNECKIISLES